MCLSRLGMAISSPGSIKGLKICINWAGWTRCRVSLASNRKDLQRLPMHLLLEPKRLFRLLQLPSRIASRSICRGMAFGQSGPPRETGGKYMTVPDEEIIAAIAELGKGWHLCRTCRVNCLCWFGSSRQKGDIGSDDEVLVMNTGSGLKDIRAAMQAVNEALMIEPTLSCIERKCYRKTMEITQCIRSLHRL